jgi:VanZ family protein
MAVILGLSSDLFGAERSGEVLRALLGWLLPSATEPQVRVLHALVRTGAHLVEFAVLALLWYRTLARGARLPAGRAALGAGMISAAWAGLDEARQTLTTTRSGSVVDVALDTAGAAAALLAVWLGRAALALVTSALLWTAALGGTCFLSLHAALGIDAGWLWLTTPAAWLALWGRWRHRRRARRHRDEGG